MNEILKIVVSLSLSGTFLIFILLLFCLFFKEKLNKSWQYYIWLIVIIRLFLPVTSEINFVGRIFGNFEQTAGITTKNDKQFTENISIQNLAENNSSTEEQLNAQNTELQKSWYNILKNNSGFIWLLFGLMMFIHKITIYQSFVKYIKASSSAVDDINLLEQLGSIMKQNNIKGNVELYKNGLIASPLLIGFFRPCIVLTNAEITDTDFYYIILHELTHYKRRDMFYKWLTQFTVCLHWFNPFVYLMKYEINRTCELSCDEAVIKKLDIKERKLYGNTLLNAIGAGNLYKNSAVTVTLNESKELLKERLKSIMNYKRLSKTGMFITILSTIFICVSANAAGAYSDNYKKSDVSNNITLYKLSNVVDSEKETLKADYYYLPPKEPSQREILSQYGSFGISFDKNGKMLFEGELVRYFWDGYYIEDCGRAIHYEYANKDGKIDIRTTRNVIDNHDGSVNQFGELTGIIKYNEKDFDSFVDDNGNIIVHYEVGTSDTIAEDIAENAIYDEKVFDSIANNESTFIYDETFAESSLTQKGKTFAEIFAEYRDYGIEYKEDSKGSGRGNVYYNGKLVKHFADQKNNGSVFTYESKDGGKINVYTIYDKNGKLIRIDESR